MNDFLLSNKQAINLARENLSDQPVKLISLKYNWNAPPEHNNNDVIVIWAKVSINNPGQLCLYGKKINTAWYLNTAFDEQGEFENIHGGIFKLYKLQFNLAEDFPVEFVLRYNDIDGFSHFDNNNGSNYRIIPYGGQWSFPL